MTKEATNTYLLKAMGLGQYDQMVELFVHSLANENNKNLYNSKNGQSS